LLQGTASGIEVRLQGYAWMIWGPLRKGYKEVLPEAGRWFGSLDLPSFSSLSFSLQLQRRGVGDSDVPLEFDYRDWSRKSLPPPLLTLSQSAHLPC
jgi:hypothetical protein